jgi:hypothetical protein
MNIGMSDEELEAACLPQCTGISAWYSWTSEVYSFGKCFRKLAKYPRILPLYIYADHGVGLESNFYSHELEIRKGVHFTWHPDKAIRYESHGTKKTLRIPHPWILYRRSAGIERSRDANGTIIFFTHHVPGLQWTNHDNDSYFESLKNLPDKFHPIVLCLHMHDINAGRHKDLRRHGIPLVTAGNTSFEGFVDRFYGLVRNFSYAASQDWGSQVAYCIELGIPYFYIGEKPHLINLSHKQLPIGAVDRYQDQVHENYDTYANNLFSEPTDKVTEQQIDFVSKMLGLDSTIGAKKISKILWQELFKHWMSWYLIPKGMAKFFINKIRFC